MLMKRFIFFALMLLSFCLIYNLARSVYSLPSEKERVVREVESKTAKNLQNLGLIPIGVGAQMMNRIQKLMLDFQYREDITSEEGRRLLIESVIEFLRVINGNKTIRKYLQNYPFRPENVEICIFLVKADGLNFDQGDLEVLVAKDGKVQFKFNNSTFSGYKTYEETFESAARIAGCATAI